jgi:hypothetical protein
VLNVEAKDQNAEGSAKGTLGSAATSANENRTLTFRDVDRALRRIASEKACLDAEELTWLREAELQQVWRKLGFSTALEYLEDVFGYSPRTATERLRVAPCRSPRCASCLAW